jgi:hypothetical protein
VLVQVQGDHFEQLQPEAAGEYTCDDALLELPEDTWGVELNEDRIATTYLTDDVITPES